MKLDHGVTNAEMLDNLMGRLGSRRAPPLRAALVYELNRKVDQLEAAATLPWFLEDLHIFPTVVGQQVYALPDNFLREIEEGALVLYYQGALLQQCYKVAKEDLRHVSCGEFGYTLSGSNLILSSVPQYVYEGRWDYYAASATVVDNGAAVTNAWVINAYAWITYAALEVVASFHVQDPNMAQRFAAEAKLGQDGVWRTHEARTHTNRNYMIED
jgi:hypothetical protein